MHPELDALRGRLEASLAEPIHLETLRRLRAAGAGPEASVPELAAITESPSTQARLTAWRSRVEAEGPLAPGSFERVLLVHSALASLRPLDEAPVAPAVKQRTMRVFEQLADGTLRLDQGGNRFVQFAKIASLRRWPAGLFDWESSGLPRSWLPRIRPLAELRRTLSIVGRRWHGFGPAFFSHLTICRSVRAMMQKDAQRSYYLMAESMALQPAARGLITSSWFHSPDTFRVSPHLGWLNDVFLQNGAIVATIGAAPADCGVLARSAEREQAYRNGTFKPTLGLIIWPREEMLAWARAHPELAG